MVGGVVYTTAGTRRAVVALDAATGELRWVHGEPEGGAEPPLRDSCRELQNDNHDDHCRAREESRSLTL